MKKILISLFLFILVIGGAQSNNDFTLANYFSGNYYAYTDIKLNSDSTFLGSCYMVNHQIGDVTKLVGESMVINNFEPTAALKKLKAQVRKTEYLDTGASVIYAYSPLINKEVEIDNLKVNIQIACYDEYSVIGWPLILGSF